MHRKSSVAAMDIPLRDQPMSEAMGCRNTASENIAPTETQVISMPTPTTTQPRDWKRCFHPVAMSIHSTRLVGGWSLQPTSWDTGEANPADCDRCSRACHARWPDHPSIRRRRSMPRDDPGQARESVETSAASCSEAYFPAPFQIRGLYGLGRCRPDGATLSWSRPSIYPRAPDMLRHGILGTLGTSLSASKPEDDVAICCHRNLTPGSQASAPACRAKIVPGITPTGSVPPPRRSS